jgi:hypothetical protein
LTGGATKGGNARALVDAAMRALLTLALLTAVLLAGCGRGPSAGETAGNDPESTLFARSYFIQANLTPPVTTFRVIDSAFNMMATHDMNASSSYNYAWTNSNACGRFTFQNNSATWDHGDDTNCGHESPSHPGTITVVVGGLSESVASTGYMTCVYEDGSNTGQGKSCTVSSVANPGGPEARDTSVPGPGLALALAGVAVAALAARRR